MDDDSRTITIDKEKLRQLVDAKVKQRLKQREQDGGLALGRRGFIGALAAAAGLGAAGYGWVMPAAAQSSAAGQIGTPSQLVDIYAHSIGDSNNPVQEVYINNEFVQDQQNSASIDDISDNGSGTVNFTAPLAASTATVSSTFTDPSGTDHSGELADASDVVSDHSNLSGVASDQHHAQVHGNGDHTSTYVADGDGTDREIFVINNGASDPSAAGPDDIILERE